MEILQISKNHLTRYHPDETSAKTSNPQLIGYVNKKKNINAAALGEVLNAHINIFKNVLV